MGKGSIPNRPWLLAIGWSMDLSTSIKSIFFIVNTWRWTGSPCRATVLPTLSLTESETEMRTLRVDLLENVSVYFQNSTLPVSSKLRRRYKSVVKHLSCLFGFENRKLKSQKIRLKSATGSTLHPQLASCLRSIQNRSIDDVEWFENYTGRTVHIFTC